MLLLLIMYTAQKCARSAQKVGRLGGSTLVQIKTFQLTPACNRPIEDLFHGPWTSQTMLTAVDGLPRETGVWRRATHTSQT